MKVDILNKLKYSQAIPLLSSRLHVDYNEQKLLCHKGAEFEDSPDHINTEKDNSRNNEKGMRLLRGATPMMAKCQCTIS